jgi:hypothetical protein
MNTIRTAIAAALFRLASWIAPLGGGGPPKTPPR